MQLEAQYIQAEAGHIAASGSCIGWRKMTIESAIFAMKNLSIDAGYFSGCYAITKNGHIVYIGESKNIKKRMATHPLRGLLKNGHKLKCFPCENRKEIEKELIKFFNPKLNIVFRTKKMKSKKKVRVIRHKKLWQYLKDINCTQQKFAEILGVNRVTIHGWLTGKRKPDMKGMKKLSNVTDGYFSLEDFYTNGAIYA